MTLLVLPRFLGAYSRQILLALFWTLAGASLAHAQDAHSLKARHAALREQLASNQFQRPLYLESSETSGELKGDIYAVVDYPYRMVGRSLRDVHDWCDILILHLNVKNCVASARSTGEMLSVSIGRKFDQPLADTHLVDFQYKVAAWRPDYLQVALNAAEGPLDTSNYRIMLEVAALDADHSFLHFSYSYAYGVAARVATQGYLSTIGRGRVGFSIIGRKAGGQPAYIGGMRGIVERNTMRYYLAIESYLGALSLPPGQQLEKRLNDWYDGIERYPVQLHELERSEYLAMKRNEVRRQQEAGSSAAEM